MPYAKIHIENLGPIREGTFELRPLTIFIGPNNSGKTYAATAAYELINALAFERRYRRDRLSSLTFGDSGSKHHLSHAPSDGTRLGDEILNQVRHHLETTAERVKFNLREGLLDAFAVESLTSMLDDKDVRRTLEVALVDPRTDRPVVGVRGGPLHDLAFADFDLRGLAQVGVEDADDTSPRRTYDGHPNDEIANEVWGDMLEDLGLPKGRGIYLPASRLGIIQGWTVLAASAIRSLRQQAGRIRDELPPAPGVYGDFFERLVTLGAADLPRREFPKHFASAAALLESKILQGQIIRESTSLGIMRLIYRTPEFDLPLERASSTVGDMAPLAIALKEQLSLGDLLERVMHLG